MLMEDEFLDKKDRKSKGELITRSRGREREETQSIWGEGRLQRGAINPFFSKTRANRSRNR